jgi:flagellar biosynthesis protein FlhB
MADKTEEPTPRRLRQAREQGDVAISGALSQSVAFLVALAIAPAWVAATFAAVSTSIRNAASGRALAPAELGFLVLALTLPLVGAVAFATFVSGSVQGGGLFHLGRAVPKLERLNPLAGLGALFSLERATSILRALVAATVVLLLAASSLRELAPALAGTAGQIDAALGLAGTAAARIARDAALVGLALGLLDFVVLRRAWRRRWMMTRAEAQREFKETEGDPEIKAARRRAHQEVLIRAQLGAVERARVVIVNPTHFATALEYQESEHAAPRVVAQGQGEIARRIIDAARAHGVPVVRDLPVARALSELEVGDEIPEALYEAVAMILRELIEGEARAEG